MEIISKKEFPYKEQHLRFSKEEQEILFRAANILQTARVLTRAHGLPPAEELDIILSDTKYYLEHFGKGIDWLDKRSIPKRTE